MKLDPIDPVGPTGRFSQGPLDEGEIIIGIAYDESNDIVIIRFGKNVSWLGMSPSEAIDFANGILTMAKKSKGKESSK